MAWSAALCTDLAQMTMLTTTSKICAFFFTGLDQSRLDLSDIEKERNQCDLFRVTIDLYVD